MTERYRGGAYADHTKTAGGGEDLGPRKTLFVLVVVTGCFAVLWPKVFYPMFVGDSNPHIRPSPIDRTSGCCDVISEKDVNTIKIMSELCSTIIQKDQDAPLSGREIVEKCTSAVMETCGFDISAVLQEKVRLGQTTRQILDQVRSSNGSLCLKYNFGLAPWRLDVPHRVNIEISPSYTIRQERSINLRSEMVHPAFRERGSAIPQTHSTATRRSPAKVVEGRPGPIPAMRPVLGAGSRMVPPQKQTTGTMGVVMPIYTIGIVIFFTYTVMRLMLKKQPECLYPDVTPDPVFRKEVFQSNRGRLGSRGTRNDTKLVVNAVSALLEEVDNDIASNRKTADKEVVPNGAVPNQDEEQPSVKILGMETRASCEGGKKWSRSGSPVLPTPHLAPREPVEPPQEIYLEGSLPPQSHHLLVSDAATEAQKTNSEEDPAVVLAGKMTLSVISLDSSENGTDKSSDSDKKQEERSSSNVSEDFEKIEVELDEQINSIIDQAQEMALDQSLLDEIKKELSEIGNERRGQELGDLTNEELKCDLDIHSTEMDEAKSDKESHTKEFSDNVVLNTKDLSIQLVEECKASQQNSDIAEVIPEGSKPLQNLNYEKNTPEVVEEVMAEADSADNYSDMPAEEENIYDAEDVVLDKLNAAIVDLATEFRPQSEVMAMLQAEEDVADEEDSGEEVEYEYEGSDNEELDEEIRNAGRLENRGDQTAEPVNGQSQEQEKNGINSSSSAEDDLSEDEHLPNENREDEDVEVEEIIEYVTDEEEEEEDDMELEHSNNINHLNGSSGATR